MFFSPFTCTAAICFVLMLASANGECCTEECQVQDYITGCPACTKPRFPLLDRIGDAYCETRRKDEYYCGVGVCNVFGCNCDNGCRGAYCKKKWKYLTPVQPFWGRRLSSSIGQPTNDTVATFLSLINGTRTKCGLDLTEFTSFVSSSPSAVGYITSVMGFPALQNHTNPALQLEAERLYKKQLKKVAAGLFKSIDEDNNGMINPGEIDASLADYQCS